MHSAGLVSSVVLAAVFELKCVEVLALHSRT